MAKNTKPTCFQYEYSAPLSEDQIKEIANEWVKEAGWYEFDYNDFMSCIRAIERAPLSEDQIKEIANEWVKEPGWYEFDYNDFISCIRAIERAYGITGDNK